MTFYETPCRTQSLTRWLYCVDSPQYSVRLEALGYVSALAVYFGHSTRPKVQGLVSRDSIVDRQFVTNSAQL